MKYETLQMVVVYLDENDICTTSTLHVDGDDTIRYPWKNGWSGNEEV